MNMFKGIVYKVSNISNGKMYIGITTKDLHTRKLGHLRDSKKGSSFLLHRAIRKYGKENFKWEIIENVHTNINNLYEREIYWIQFYNSTNTKYGYNLSGGGINPRLKKDKHPLYGKGHSKKAKNKISQNHADCSGEDNANYKKINIHNLIIDLLSVSPYYLWKDLKIKYKTTPQTLRKKLRNYNIDIFNFISDWRINRSFKTEITKTKKKNPVPNILKTKKMKNKILNSDKLNDIIEDYIYHYIKRNEFILKYGFSFTSIKKCFKRYKPDIFEKRRTHYRGGLL